MISYLYDQTPHINEIQHNGERIGEPTWTIATLYLSLLCVQRRLGHISVKQVRTVNYVVLTGIMWHQFKWTIRFVIVCGNRMHKIGRLHYIQAMVVEVGAMTTAIVHHYWYPTYMYLCTYTCNYNESLSMLTQRRSYYCHKTNIEHALTDQSIIT